VTRGFILRRINAGGVKYATTKRERAMKCRECKQEREGGIVDKIVLCHACYINTGGANE